MPRVGQFQWAVREDVHGYEDTKQEAIDQAVAMAAKDGERFYDLSTWAVGKVVKIHKVHVDYGYQGRPSSRTVVTVSIVALGHASFTDEPLTIPVGMAQGRAR